MKGLDSSVFDADVKDTGQPYVARYSWGPWYPGQNPDG